MHPQWVTFTDAFLRVGKLLFSLQLSFLLFDSSPSITIFICNLNVSNTATI